MKKQRVKSKRKGNMTKKIGEKEERARRDKETGEGR